MTGKGGFMSDSIQNIIELLQSLPAEGLNNLDTPTIKALNRGIKENFVMRTHPYKITRQKSGRWKTYIRRPAGTRKSVERNNRDDLIEFLYQHYSEDDKKSAVMDRVFDEFLEYKRDVLSRSQETVERIRYTYRRFMTEEIRQRKMSSITETELMRYVRLIVYTEHPKERALKSFLQMIHGLFRFGYDNHYTSSDVSKRIVAENFYKDCDCSKKEAGEKIFSPAEIHLIREAANQKLPNPRAFMILLAIETGMRAGELCALHWDDISETDIHIHRQQLIHTRNGKREGFYEVPYTKDERRHPHGGRYFPLTTRCRQLLDQLRTTCDSSSEYVFSEEGEWIHKTSYEQFLKRLCKNLGLSITNNHAFRMSLNSNVLIKAGLDAKTRAAILGHSIATNESYYTYTRRDEIQAVGSTIDQFTTVIG